MQHPITDETTHSMPQTVSRREFFKRIGAVLVGGALFFGGRLAPTAHAAPPAAPRLNSSLERSTFARYVGETFNVRADALSVTPLQLTEVRAVSAALPSSNAEGWSYENRFTLVFRGTRALAQGTYPFSHPHMGSFALFIAPGARDQAAFTYAAVIHRLRA